jgi:hypothetical protein
LNLSIRTTASGEILAERAMEDEKVNPTRSAMISSTRFTISSIVALFSSISYVSSAFVQLVEEPSTTHAKILERRSRRPDRCLSRWYHHERLLG